jgi:hypothetical protein
MPLGCAAAPVRLSGLGGCGVSSPLFLHLGGPIVGRRGLEWRRSASASSGHRNRRRWFGCGPILSLHGGPFQVLGLVRHHFRFDDNRLFRRLFLLLGFFRLPVEEQVDDHVPFGLPRDDSAETEHLSHKPSFPQPLNVKWRESPKKLIRWKNCDYNH